MQHTRPVKRMFIYKSFNATSAGTARPPTAAAGRTQWSAVRRVTIHTLSRRHTRRLSGKACRQDRVLAKGACYKGKGCTVVTFIAFQ